VNVLTFNEEDEEEAEEEAEEEDDDDDDQAAGRFIDRGVFTTRRFLTLEGARSRWLPQYTAPIRFVSE
jgi:hypothetical protein